MKTLFLSALALVTLGFTTGDKLTGRWQSQPSEKGNVTSVVFNDDNSFEGFVNRKPFVSGHYNLQEDTFSFTDNGCDGKQGIYRIIFFSENDSMRFVPVNDSCTPRREGMSRLVMGRVK